MAGRASILHADLDAFYASVEVRDDPRLIGLPVAVGGGVVLAATYEARAFGVRSAMPGRRARELCPGLVVVPARFGAYVEASKAVMEILTAFTPLVEPISIDEAFLDVSGAQALFGTPRAIGEAIRERVRREVGVPISVGIATTKHLAKIASRVAKPDGLVEVPPGGEREFLDPLPVGHLWGVGPVGERRLASYGILTIGDLAETPRSSLQRWLGDHWGSHLSHLAINYDPRSVDTRRRAGSVGAQSAGHATDPETRHRNLLALADRIGTRMRRKSVSGRRVTVRVRFDDMASVSRAQTLPGPISETTAIYRVACALVEDLIAERSDDRGITLVGISLSQLEKTPPLQLALDLDVPPEDPVARSGTGAHLRRFDLDRAVDQARDRYGRDAIRQARLLRDSPEQRSPIEEMEGDQPDSR